MDSDVTRERLETVVRKSVSEALAYPLDQVTMESRLITDLDAESIDLLDIRFRLEHECSIKIRQEEIVASVGADVTASELRDKLTVLSLVEFLLSRQAVPSGM